MIAGTSNARQIESLQLSHPNCKNCDAKKSLELISWSRYMHWMFIPVIPSGKESVIICKNCGKEYLIEQQHESLKEMAKKEQRKIKYPIWYFTGAGALAIIITCFLIYNMRDNELDAEYVKAPAVGDIYEYKTDDNWYSTFIIHTVSDSNVTIRYNQYSSDKSTNLGKINKMTNYLPWEIPIPRAELESMYESGKILDIIR